MMRSLGCKATPLVELICGCPPAVAPRAESSWRAGSFGGRRGDVGSTGLSGAASCGLPSGARIRGTLGDPRSVERAPLARSALADSAVGVLIVVDESPACGGGDEGVRWIRGVVGSRVRA